MVGAEEVFLHGAIAGLEEMDVCDDESHECNDPGDEFDDGSDVYGGRCRFRMERVLFWLE